MYIHMYVPCILYGLVAVSEILGKILELFEKFRVGSILIGLIQANLILFIYCAVRALAHATAHTHTDTNTGRFECRTVVRHNICSFYLNNETDFT